MRTIMLFNLIEKTHQFFVHFRVKQSQLKL